MSRGLGVVQRKVLAELRRQDSWEKLSLQFIILEVWPELDPRPHGSAEDEEGETHFLVCCDGGRLPDGSYWFKEERFENGHGKPSSVYEWTIPRSKYESVMRAFRGLKRYVHIHIKKIDPDARLAAWVREGPDGNETEWVNPDLLAVVYNADPFVIPYVAWLDKCCREHFRGLPTTLRTPKKASRSVAVKEASAT